MTVPTVTRETALRDVYKTPTGHDLLAKAFYNLGINHNLILKSPLGGLKMGALKKISFGKIDDATIDALLGMLNSEKEMPKDGKDVDVKPKWWKEAVFYQIYPRSFNDSNDDGIGDIPGIIEKLDYLKELGINAIWCSPMYDSPNDDNGYDIRDYYAIMEEFGTMEDFDHLLSEMHKRDMRLIMDLVINHSSDEHEWFKAASTDVNSPYHDYYMWKESPKDVVPNNWESLFSGNTWNYYPQVDKWALHLFSKKQMDLNWENENLRHDLYKMINFWLEKGVDGFRLDVISFISKAPGLPDGSDLVGKIGGFRGVEHYFYGPKLHEYLHEMRMETFEKHDAFTVGECQGTGIEMSKMMTADYRKELDVVFSFDHLENPGRQRFDTYLYDLRPMAENWIDWQENYGNHCWPTVFFENHDVPRMPSKADPEDRYHSEISKLLALFQMTLRGTPFVYQGQEMGMRNTPFKSIDEFKDVESLNLYQKLTSEGKTPQEAFKTVLSGSRDHARVPVMWDGTENGGFTKGEPWIRTNPIYTLDNIANQQVADNSILKFYQKMITLRKTNKALVYGDFTRANWSSKNALCYYRTLNGERFYIELNLTNKKRNRPASAKGYEHLAGSYNALSDELRPFEGNLYRCN